MHFQKINGMCVGVQLNAGPLRSDILVMKKTKKKAGLGRGAGGGASTGKCLPKILQIISDR